MGNRIGFHDRHAFCQHNEKKAHIWPTYRPLKNCRCVRSAEGTDFNHVLQRLWWHRARPERMTFPPTTTPGCSRLHPNYPNREQGASASSPLLWVNQDCPSKRGIAQHQCRTEVNQRRALGETATGLAARERGYSDAQSAVSCHKLLLVCLLT